MNTVILPSAFADLLEGFDFYEAQAENLGSYFQDQMFREIEGLKRHAGVHRKLFGYHHMASRRFPFVIYYDLEAGNIIVYRVLDARRDPEWIKKQLN